MELTFDRAIELLEITEIGKITPDDIPALLKKARRRWHPDSVSHRNDPSATAEFTAAFQQLDLACEMVRAYLKGEYQAGEGFTATPSREQEEPAEVIRREAPAMQARLKALWEAIRAKAFKKTTEKVQLSDGFKLKDLLDEDLKDDIAFLSMVAFAFGFIPLALLTGLAGSANPVIGGLLAGGTLLFCLCCILGAAPLSRFWLPAPVTPVVIWAVNFGLRIYRMVAPDPNKPDQPGWLVFLVCLPVLMARLVKWLVVWPLYAIAKAAVGDKVVGVVYQEVHYYAGAAEWYVEELLSQEPEEMTEEELFHLSHLYSELTGVVHYVYVPDETVASPSDAVPSQAVRKSDAPLAWFRQSLHVVETVAWAMVGVVAGALIFTPHVAGQWSWPFWLSVAMLPLAVVLAIRGPRTRGIIVLCAAWLLAWLSSMSGGLHTSSSAARQEEVAALTLAPAAHAEPPPAAGQANAPDRSHTLAQAIRSEEQRGRATPLTPALRSTPVIGNAPVANPADARHSPTKTFSIERVEGAPPSAPAWENCTLILRHGDQEVARYSTLGFILEAHWSQDERYVAINNRRGNAGDYLWVIRTSDGVAIKRPDDAQGREIEERALVQADEAAKRMSPAFQRRKSWITALGWTQDVKLRASVHAGYIIPNSDGWAQDIPVLLSLAGNNINIENIGNVPDGYVQPLQSPPDFRRWMHENWNIVMDRERRELIIEFDWGARFGAMRWSAPASAFALSEASVGATNERGAFRDSTRVKIPLRPGYSAVMQKWEPSVTVNLAEAPWLTSVPPNSVVKESEAVEVYARGPTEAAELVAALKRVPQEQMPPSVSPAGATERTPAAGKQPESRLSSAEESIAAFIRAHHEKASRRDAAGFSGDYAETFNLKGQRTARSTLLSETQAYHRDHPQVSEKIVSTLTITGATTAEPRVRYRMDSSTTHLQKKDSRNVLLLELHLRSKGDGTWEIVQENELERVKQTPPASVPTPPTRPAKPAAKPPGKSSSPLRERVRSLEDL